MTTTTEVAKRDEVGGLIESMQGQWAKVLPRVCTPERFARMALSCIRKNPTLQTAIATPQGKTSILAAFMTCAELGIETDGRRAHLIPFKNGKGGYDITLIIDYKGVAELVMRSGLVSNIHADKVCENDVFEVNKGRIEKHVPDYKKPRGKAYAYYCNILFKDGSEKCEIMTLDEIEKISQRSKAVQNYNRKTKDGEWAAETPWQTDFDEMAKKTVFKRCSKWVPLSPEVRDAIAKDDEEFEDHKEAIPVPVEILESAPVSPFEIASESKETKNV